MATTPNRLIHSTSPYLLQHALNPVDWYPWGDEALALAKALDRPIFLSIGYSACHWCHVMEKESFEDPQVAAVLNASFVPIKVDREERPDLDELYMTAVQLIAGQGGWPMNVWLTPELAPFFGGTYFPPESRFGLPGFLPLLEHIALLWNAQKQEVRRDASRLVAELEQITEIRPGTALPDPAVFFQALDHLRHSFDPQFGGFGFAPKFPPHMALEFLLRRGSADDLIMVTRTLDAMAAGGIYDQLGGGFSRYSVDERWLVPHFEKMLYDNALLAIVYLRGFKVTGQPRYAQVARETLDYLLRDMADPAGGFYCAEDADAEGEEGRFYVFTPDQVRRVLGSEAEAFCEAYGITAEGNFGHGRSVLHRLSPHQTDLTPLEQARHRLRQARDLRVRPFKDDKVLASWNGLVLSALSWGYRVLQAPQYLTAAVRCASFLQQQLWQDHRLLRVWRRGQAHTPGFLEDYAAVAVGAIDLFETSTDEQWLTWSCELAKLIQERFEDPDEGGFYGTERDIPHLLFRKKITHDSAMPSGLSLALQALTRLAYYLDEPSFHQSAKRALMWIAPSLTASATAFLGVLNVDQPVSWSNFNQ